MSSAHLRETVNAIARQKIEFDADEMRTSYQSLLNRIASLDKKIGHYQDRLRIAATWPAAEVDPDGEFDVDDAHNLGRAYVDRCLARRWV